MKEIIFGLLGAGVIGILIEILLPDKEMKKYCVFALGIISAMIIISPIIRNVGKLKAEEFDYFSFKNKDEVINAMKDSEDIAFELAMENYLADNGIDSVVTAYIENDNVVYIGITLKSFEDKERAVDLLSTSLRIEKWRINCYGR